MDLGVIVSCKRFYQRKYLDEIRVAVEEEEGLKEDSRGQQTPMNTKTYNIRSTIYNFASRGKLWK